MTVQEGTGTFKERVCRKSYPAVEGTDFGTTLQDEREKVLEPEEGSVVNRVGRGFQ